MKLSHLAGAALLGLALWIFLVWLLVVVAIGAAL